MLDKIVQYNNWAPPWSLMIIKKGKLYLKPSGKFPNNRNLTYVI